jgi:hypothetical protein
VARTGQALPADATGSQLAAPLMTDQIRNATPDDTRAIMSALEKLSDEIPINMDKEDNRNALGKIVAECCEQNSWVALDEAGHVIGFLLSKKCEFDRIELPYGGVLKGHRRQGWFYKLLSKAKALKRPLQVDVSHENKSDMADRLVKEGFRKEPCSLFPNQDCFIWLPKSQPNTPG